MERKMSELIERYVHQVGRYLPGKERAEIQAELRSQIQDQLEDRYEGAPTQTDVAAVLKELGDPRRMAASYGGEQYLVGPDLYPVMMMVLRRGWIIVPPIAILVRLLAMLFGEESGDLITVLLETAAGAFQATAIFTGIVVLIFAILQHSGEDLDEITGNDAGFDPLALPEVNDPAEVDRFEAIFGMAFGTFAILVMLYFLRVGGLTWRFNLADPGDVIPVPVPWLVGLIVIATLQMLLQLTALLRGRWNVPMWLLNTTLDIVGAVALYFVLWLPLAERLYAAVPALAGLPLVGRGAEAILVISIISTVIGGVSKLVKMLSHRPSTPTSYNVKAN
jgi:hypothetical protein